MAGRPHTRNRKKIETGGLDNVTVSASKEQCEQLKGFLEHCSTCPMNETMPQFLEDLLDQIDLDTSEDLSALYIK